MHGPAAPAQLGVDRRHVIGFLLTMDLLLVVLHVVSRWLVFNGERVFGRAFEGHELLDLDAEVSIPTWWQQLLVFGAAALGFLLARLARDAADDRARYWTALACVLVFVSIDEGAEIHERLIEPMRSVFGITGGVLWFAWLIPGLAALAAFVAVFARFWWGLPRRPRTLLAVGGGLYLVGAVAFEMMGGAYESANVVHDMTYSMIIAAEEGFEMIGMTVFIVGLVTMISLHLQDRVLRISVHN